MILANPPFVEIHVPGGKPDATGPDDFGKPEDVDADFGLCLTLKGWSLADMIEAGLDADCFGVYLGRSCKGWVVGVTDVLSWDVKHLLIYGSLLELKEVWELD